MQVHEAVVVEVHPVGHAGNHGQAEARRFDEPVPALLVEQQRAAAGRGHKDVEVAIRVVVRDRGPSERPGPPRVRSGGSRTGFDGLRLEAPSLIAIEPEGRGARDEKILVAVGVRVEPEERPVRRRVQAGGGGHLGKGPARDLAMELRRTVPTTDVKVEAPVAVKIHPSHMASSAALLGESGGLGHILEAPVGVTEELVAVGLGEILHFALEPTAGDEEIHPSVAVRVRPGHPVAILEKKREAVRGR